MKFKIGDKVKVKSKTVLGYSISIENKKWFQEQFPRGEGTISGINGDGSGKNNKNCIVIDGNYFSPKDLELLPIPKFRIGDKVECIRSDYDDSSIIGIAGIVSKIIGDEIWCKNWSNGEKGYLKAHLLELLAKSEFRVGEKVRLIKNKDMNANIGEIATITGLGKLEDYKWIKVKWDNHISQSDGLYDVECFELLTKQPSSEPIRGKVNKMKAFLLRKLSASKRAQYKAGLRQDDLTLTEEGKEVLLNMLADRKENDTELTEVAKDMLSEK